MIVVESDGALLCATQHDCAHVAAQLAALWRDDELLGHRLRDSLLLALRRHADGWAGLDAAPRVGPSSGRPCDHRSLPAELRWKLWRNGADALAADDPIASLLALRSVASLAQLPGFAALHEQLRSWGVECDELVAQLGLEAAVIDPPSSWLARFAQLALLLCEGIPSDGKLGRYRYRVRRQSLLLDPFPFAGRTTFQLHARTIPARRYEGDADLALELATARWRRVALRVAPLSGESRVDLDGTGG